MEEIEYAIQYDTITHVEEQTYLFSLEFFKQDTNAHGIAMPPRIKLDNIFEPILEAIEDNATAKYFSNDTN